MNEKENIFSVVFCNVCSNLYFNILINNVHMEQWNIQHDWLHDLIYVRPWMLLTGVQLW